MGTFNTKTRNSELHISLGLFDKSSLEDASEKTPHIVSLIASVLEKNIQKNDKLLKKSRTKDGGTIFHGTKAPALNIRQYIERIFKYSKCSPSCFVVAYIYMDRFIQATSCYLTSLNAHRLLIACVMVATKFLEDVYCEQTSLLNLSGLRHFPYQIGFVSWNDRSYNNSYFAKIGGVSITEMNKLEVKLLCSLDYRLHVTLEAFDQYCLQLEKAASNGSERRSCHIERAIQTCGLKGSWLKKDESKCNPKFAGYTCGAI